MCSHFTSMVESVTICDTSAVPSTPENGFQVSNETPCTWQMKLAQILKTFIVLVESSSVCAVGHHQHSPSWFRNPFGTHDLIYVCSKIGFVFGTEVSLIKGGVCLYEQPPHLSHLYGVMRFCYCFSTSRQWLSLYRCLVLTVVPEVAATRIGVFCEVRTKCLKLVIELNYYFLQNIRRQ
jgi:hypothetical protein